MGDNGPTTSFLQEDGTPDWDAISFDACCSRCGYNLRTLSRPLCPECGLSFEWLEVLDRAASAGDYSFENNWRTRPIVSWALTVCRTFRPRKFWAAASIHDRVVPTALWLMMVAALLLFPVTVHGGAFCLSMFLDGAAYLLRTWGVALGSQSGAPLVTHIDSLSGMLHFVAELPINEGWTFNCSILGGPAVFLLAGLGLIISLQQTLGRCRVRTAQVLRVVAHAAAPVCVLLAMIYLVVACAVFLAGDNDAVVGPFVFVAYASIVIVPGHYLSAGLKHYLHLPRPRIVGYVAAVVSTLTLFAFGTLMLVKFGGP